MLHNCQNGLLKLITLISQLMHPFIIGLQWNLSIMVTLGPDISGHYIQVAVIEKTCIRWSAAF